MYQRAGQLVRVAALSVLAIGTSLPELTITVLAALERRCDVAIGTIIGSNTFNLLTIMGVTALLSPNPIAVSDRFLLFEAHRSGRRHRHGVGVRGLSGHTVRGRLTSP